MPAIKHSVLAIVLWSREFASASVTVKAYVLVTAPQHMVVVLQGVTKQPSSVLHGGEMLVIISRQGQQWLCLFALEAATILTILSMHPPFSFSLFLSEKYPAGAFITGYNQITPHN